MDVDGVSVVLGGTPVLRAVSFSVRPGRIAAVVGPNGAGKSTLLRAIVGAAPCAGGGVRLEGRPIVAAPSRRVRVVGGWSDAEVAARLAYAGQRPSAPAGYSVARVVGFGRYAARGERGFDARPVLAFVGLEHRAADRVDRLSAGQQQRVDLARAFAQLAFDRPPPKHRSGRRDGRSARVLLADEPTSAQDPAHAVEVLDLFRRFAAERGLAALVVLHDLSLAARFADDAVLLTADGRVAHAGPALDALAPARLAEVFGGRFVTGEVGGVPVRLPA